MVNYRMVNHKANNRVNHMAKAKKSKKPPSRIRYEQSHPTIACRASRELYDELNKVRVNSGKSFADILKEGLGKQEATVGEAYKRGYAEGSQDGKRNALSGLPLGHCSICGKGLVWDLNSAEDKRLILKAIDKMGVQHADGCE